MIKFIASDLDGTILLNGAQSVDTSTIEYIDRLLDKGIYFAPASGRQITSLKRLFEPVSDRLVYIAENGALVEYKGEVIGKTVMDYKLAMDIIQDVWEQPNCEILVSGQHTAYIKPKTEAYLHRMTKVVNYKTTIIDKFTDIDEDILKIAVCDLTGIENSKEHFFEKWTDKAAITVSGKLYLDLMETSVSKGKAIGQIQDYFGLSKTECMAFGDNFNDVTMLDMVSESYVMENAVDEVKMHGRYICDNVESALRKVFGSI